MSEAQQIFSVFYAIFFGIMLQTIGTQRANPNEKTNKKKPEATLNLFDTPNAWAIGYKSWNKPLWRFLLSIAFLNLLPALIFGITYRGLKYAGELDVLKIIIIVVISLIPHYIYRIYLGILVMFTDELYLNEKDSEKYSKADLDASDILKTDRKQRKDAHTSIFSHLAITCLWIFPMMVLLYDLYLVPNQINQLYIHTSQFLIVLGLIFFFAWRKNE